MRRLLQRLVLSLVASAVILATVAAYRAERITRPFIIDARKSLVAASPSEINPPSSITRVLEVTEQSSLKHQVARLLLLSGGIHRHSEWQPYSLALELALPFHFSQRQLTTIYLNRAYMGKDIEGFAQASIHYLGVPLEQVNAAQATRLFAIASVPSSGPERQQRVAENIALRLSQ